jgi:ELWxxDGT repeat protein
LSGVGDSVYFHVRHANGSETGHGFKEQLWKADGLTNAVYMVTEFDEFGRMTEVVGLGDSAFFVFKGKLWKTDGSPRNMTRIVVPGVVEPSDYYYHRGNRLVMHDGKLYFSLLNKNKRELWLTDGSQAGTRLVKVIKPDGPYYSSDNFRFLASVGNFLYFQSDDNVHGTELWKTDGTPNGTAMLRDINPGSDFDSSFWESLAAPEMENSFFFAPPTVGAYLEDMGLWKTNGTSASTIFIKDPAQYPHTGNIKFGAIYNNEAYFYFSEYFDSSQVNRHELWKTDGTTAGTVKVKNFNREKINSASFFVLGDSLFFWAGGGYSTGSNYHLWRVTKGEATKVLPGSLHLLLHDDE